MSYASTVSTASMIMPLLSLPARTPPACPYVCKYFYIHKWLYVGIHEWPYVYIYKWLYQASEYTKRMAHVASRLDIVP